MRCQRCNKPATFHISELTGPQPAELHLCEEHAREYLNQAAAQQHEEKGIVSALAQGISKTLSMSRAAEELQELDQQTCPVCGISFYDFRRSGRLGCPHDYDFFGKQIHTLIQNLHGGEEHAGKVPVRRQTDSDKRILLIKLRRDLDDAVQYEDYERAARLRDKIKEIE